MQTIKVTTSAQRARELAADPDAYLAKVRAEAHEEANRPSTGRRHKRAPQPEQDLADSH